jgi:hypothetical protein
MEPNGRRRTKRLRLLTIAENREEAAETLTSGVMAMAEFSGSNLRPARLRRSRISSASQLSTGIRELYLKGYQPIVPVNRVLLWDAQRLFVDLWARVQYPV